jgi:hypothetical protein
MQRASDFGVALPLTDLGRHLSFPIVQLPQQPVGATSGASPALERPPWRPEHHGRHPDIHQDHLGMVVLQQLAGMAVSVQDEIAGLASTTLFS